MRASVLAKTTILALSSTRGFLEFYTDLNCTTSNAVQLFVLQSVLLPFTTKVLPVPILLTWACLNAVLFGGEVFRVILAELTIYNYSICTAFIVIICGYVFGMPIILFSLALFSHKYKLIFTLGLTVIAVLFYWNFFIGVSAILDSTTFSGPYRFIGISATAVSICSIVILAALIKAIKKCVAPPLFISTCGPISMALLTIQLLLTLGRVLRHLYLLPENRKLQLAIDMRI